MVDPALRAKIVAHLTEAGEALWTWLRWNRQADFGEREAAVLALVRELGPLLLAVAVEAGRVSEAGDCPHCGEPADEAWRRRDERDLVTAVGVTRVEQVRLTCRMCARSWRLADGLAGVPARQRLSPQVAKWVNVYGTAVPFRQAATLLELVTGLGISRETVRQYTERQGEARETELAEAAAQVERTHEPVGPLDPAPGELLVEADGVFVRLTDGAWHEVKVGAVGGCVDREAVRLSYLATLLPAAGFGQRLVAEAARRGALEIVGWTGPVTGRGLARLRRVTVLGDGAVWIWHLAEEHFGERVEIVDYYHASQHVWAMAKACFGEGTAAATVWATARLHELRRHGAAPVVTALRALSPATDAAREVRRQELGYFTTNAARMAYPTFRKQGLPIGSGPVESAAKHVVQQRMARAGMRWSTRGATALLTLCADDATAEAALAA